MGRVGPEAEEKENANQGSRVDSSGPGSSSSFSRVFALKRHFPLETGIWISKK
jgi:hypothetical protein